MSLILSQLEHGPTGLYQSPFRDAVDRPGAELASTCTLVLPAETKLWANRPIGLRGAGQYDARIIGLAEAGPSVSPRVYSFGGAETSIIIRDEDLDWHRIVAKYQHRLRGSAVTLQTAAKGPDGAWLPPSTWFTYFKGVLDSWEMVPGGWHLTFRTQDLALRSAFPRRAVSAADRPNAPVTSLGLYYQVVYGVHDSSALNARGLVSAIQVDTVDDVWHLSLGRLGAVPEVFADDVLVTSYSITYPLTNGFRETCIDFSGASMTGKTITASVRGLTDRGDGTGTVMTKPMQILQHALVNFGYGDWKDGDLLDPATAPLGLRVLYDTDQFLTRKGHVATLVIGGTADTSDLYTLIEAYCATFHVHPHWTEEGKLEIGPIDPHVINWMLSSPWARGRYHDLESSFALPQNTRQIVSHIIANWLPNAAEDKFHQKVEVEDLAVVEQASLSIDLANSAAAVFLDD